MSQLNLEPVLFLLSQLIQIPTTARALKYIKAVPVLVTTLADADFATGLDLVWLEAKRSGARLFALLEDDEAPPINLNALTTSVKPTAWSTKLSAAAAACSPSAAFCCVTSGLPLSVPESHR